MTQIPTTLDEAAQALTEALSRLRWAWDQVEKRGGVVERISDEDLARLALSTVGALADEQERHLRVLMEGNG